MPNKSSPAYWHDRKVQYDESLGKDEKRLYSKLAAYYEREAARLDKEIAAYYAKYSINGVLSYRNLLETLPDEDKLLLIEQLDEFVKKYPAYADLVPVRESIYKLNRLEGLRQSIAMQQLHMGAYEQQQALAFFQRQALRYANGAASFLGLGSSFCRLDSDVIRAAVGNKWCDGKDFSERIWDNRKKLGNPLHTQFVNGVIRGDDYHQLARQIRAKFVKVSQKNAERLTFTEDTYLSNEAAMQVFEREAAVTEYEYVCTGDAETCDICRGLNGERFPISQRMPGTNFPPMHPWCRCFFDPVIPEKKTLTSGADSGIIKTGLRIDPQFFSNKNIPKMSTLQLEKSIKSWQAEIEEHKKKISNPKSFYPNWDTFEERYQNGLKKHWEHEIKTFSDNIEQAKNEIKERGDSNE